MVLCMESGGDGENQKNIIREREVDDKLVYMWEKKSH